VIDHQLRRPDALAQLRRTAREVVLEHFTWPGCGRATLAAYEHALTAAP
jgi:hypothetical protein